LQIHLDCQERPGASLADVFKSELTHAFAAPESSYQPLTAAEVIARNRT